MTSTAGIVNHPSESFELKTSDGVTLRGMTWGAPDAQPVIFLHGGGQTRHAWGQTARLLSEKGWRSICLDARGHGDSDWSPDGSYSLDHFVDDLRNCIDSLGSSPAVVGASLGGMTALLTEAKLGPRFISELVLVDITPRTEPEGVERIINFMRANPEGFASLEEAAEAVAGYLPHREKPKDVSGLGRNLRLGDDGRYRWHWDPQILGLGNLGRPRGEHVDAFPLAEAARTLQIPTLLVRGQLSDIVSEEGAKEFLDMVPHADYVDVSDAGHMVAGDSNDVFSDAVIRFLNDARSEGTP